MNLEDRTVVCPEENLDKPKESSIKGLGKFGQIALAVSNIILPR